MGQDTDPISCSNVMREYGIPAYKYHHIKHMSPCTHPKFHNVIRQYKGGLVYHWRGPAGNNPIKEWIFIPDKGMRRITLEATKRFDQQQIHQHINTGADN